MLICKPTYEQPAIGMKGVKLCSFRSGLSTLVKLPSSASYRQQIPETYRHHRSNTLAYACKIKGFLRITAVVTKEMSLLGPVLQGVGKPPRHDKASSFVEGRSRI